MRFSNLNESNIIAKNLYIDMDDSSANEFNNFMWATIKYTNES